MLQLDFSNFPVLTTNRLLLRKVEMSDADEIFLLRSDPVVMKYLDRPPAKTLEDAKIFLQSISDLEKNNEAVTWAITIKENPKLVGTICYWNIKKEHYRAEAGYVLLPEFHGKAIMQEAFSEVLDYGFNVMKLHSVEANVNPFNEASIKLLERNGFVREAYFKENYFYEGKFLDSAIYSLLVSAYIKSQTE
ncbi:MAG: GNAT family N-acetyltransferase [Ignavibacteriales bacterium]|nr:MAG: GNAT family N-acetyltransferase [Ignavibacteriales bacterium]